MKNGKQRGENKNREKGGHPGKEFWSRRPYFGEGRIGKVLTHRAERRRAQSAAKKEAGL